MYGAVQAVMAQERAGTGASAEQQAAAQVATLAQAAASGRYPNLAAAFAVADPPRAEDVIFESCITRLIDVALKS